MVAAGIHTTTIMDDGTTTPRPLENKGSIMKLESEARVRKKEISKDIVEKIDARQTQWQKLHRVRVKVGRGIDRGCKGMNEFDEAPSFLIPRIMDVNCTKWKDQSPSNIEKLMSAIDNEFEYLGSTLSEKGFKNLVKI